MSAPAPQLSGKKVTILLYSGVLVTISAVVGFTMYLGRASDKPLPVVVTCEKRPVPVPGGSGAVVTDVIVVVNQSDAPIDNVDIAINDQYFLYRDSPIEARKEIVVPQTIFSTKSNQRYNPARYPITSVTVTGRLPSGARGVHSLEKES